MYEEAKNFVRRHRPTLSLRRERREDSSIRLVVRSIAFRRSAFDLIDSEHLDYRRYSPSEDFRSAHVAVVPMHTATLDWAMQRIPWIVWRQAAAGRLALVFDRSGEGAPHSEKVSAQLHGILREKGVDPAGCLLLTQNRVYRGDYLAYCRNAGIVRSMQVFEYDYFIGRFFHDYAESGSDVFQRRLSAFQARPAERERTFISLNHRIRPQRLMFLLALLRDGLFERGSISFGGVKHPGDPDDTRVGKDRALEMLRSEPGFEDMAPTLVPLLPKLLDLGEVFFGKGSSFATTEALAADFDTDLYASTWFTVVTETEMKHRPMRITEKAFKPLVNFHPFLIFGNPGSLAQLKAFGFQTFGAVLDEGYDDEENPRRRFDRVYREVQRLCGLDQVELRGLETRLRDVLISNARHGLLEMPKIYRDQLNRALLEKVRAIVRA